MFCCFLLRDDDDVRNNHDAYTILDQLLWHLLQFFFFFLCLLIYFVLTCVQANADTLEVVSTLIAEQLAIDVSEVQAESKFTDLGADSLDTVRVL
jgi:hypothetical protein